MNRLLLLSKKPVTKDHILEGSIYMQCPEYTHPESEDSWLPMAERGWEKGLEEVGAEVGEWESDC